MDGKLDLSGAWQIRWSDGQRHRLEQAIKPGTAENRVEEDEQEEPRWIDARVPGEVHLDLLQAGIIADPYVGTNVLAARWVEEFQWTYRRAFELKEIPPGRAWLVFEGLDLDATILLNGQEVGRHHNTFHPCRIDVTGRLRAGGNVVHVHMDSGVWSAAEKPAGAYQHWPDSITNKRHWLRKPQFQFGWDWAQRLVNVGIFKPVRLEWSGDAPARVDQLVPLVEVAELFDRATVRARVFVEGLAAEARRGVMRVEIPDAEVSREIDVQIAPGTNRLECVVEVANPELWWPVGHGEQARYLLRATLEIDGRAIDRREAKIGFRHVVIDQSPHPQGGRHFTLVVNGRKVFAKGGNFVPADMILARIDRARYEKLIDLALEQNFNFLRVWGGGLYESDDFYDLCDERGILVWQEFIFACSRYPTHDEAFFNDVKNEATYNVRRLASHPSLVVWCGNNEIEWGDWDWDYAKTGVIMPDHGFYHITLPRILGEEDPTRYYQPSSPYSPGRIHPNADHAGDQHPWSSGFFTNDFRAYRTMICRFADEGGTLGPTSLPTMLACLPPLQRRVLSFAWQVHDNSVATWARPSPPDQFLRDWLGKEPHEMSIERFTYWAGLLQGEALREYCENFRRRMFDSSAAVFWMFNDCWPATRSWTTVDYYLRRTPAFHAVRRALAPVHVIVAEEGNDVSVFGVNDTPRALAATLSFGVMHLAHGTEHEQRADVTLPPNASTRLASFRRSAHWPRPQESVAFAILRDGGGHVIAKNRLFLPRFSEMSWPKPQVNVKVEGDRAIFTSGTFAWGVCLDLDGERRLFDNFFDVYPQTPHVIEWAEPDPPIIQAIGNLVREIP